MGDGELDVEAQAHEDFAKALLQRAGGATPDFVNKYVKPAALPTALGIAGGMMPGGPVAKAVMGGVGSGLGEGINQAMGITEPSLTNIATATGLPMAASAAGGLIAKAAPFLMPGRYAAALNALGPEATAAKLATLEPLVPASKLFERASQVQVKVPMNRSVSAIENMLDDLTNVSTGVQKTNSTVINYLKGLRTTIQSNPQGMDPMRLQKELEGAGNIIKSVNVKGGSGQGAIKNVYKALVNDLDDAAKMGEKMNPGGPGVQTLIDAREAFKREAVLNDIGEIIDKATKTPKGQGDLVSFDASKVITKLRTDDRLKNFYQDAFTNEERTGLEKLLYTVNKLPNLRPAASQNYGSGRIMGTATATGGLGYAGSGGDPLATGLALAGGTALPGGIEIGKDIALALKLGTGRALMTELLKQSKGSMTPQVASVIAAFAAAVRAGQVKE